MDMKCEVVGWVLLDDAASVLVRDENGCISTEGANPEGTFAHQGIQTGSFRRHPIIDAVTNETIGYDLEPLPSPLLPFA